MLMIKSLIIIFVVGSISFYYTNIESSSAFVSVVLPIVDFFAMVALGLWFITLFHKIGINQTSNSSDGGSTGFFGGGDGGGDGGGC
ncbi:MAG: hypothetical protein ABW157_02225 [Candidatus Thiodiazotropha sp. LLP2]